MAAKMVLKSSIHFNNTVFSPVRAGCHNSIAVLVSGCADDMNRFGLIYFNFSSFAQLFIFPIIFCKR